MQLAQCIITYWGIRTNPGVAGSLVACYPPGSVDYRIVVRARLVDIT
jgi:hypothetical protein